MDFSGRLINGQVARLGSERLSARTRGILGHLDQEAYALRRANGHAEAQPTTERSEVPMNSAATGGQAPEPSGSVA